MLLSVGSGDSLVLLCAMNMCRVVCTVWYDSCSLLSEGTGLIGLGYRALETPRMRNAV